MGGYQLTWRQVLTRIFSDIQNLEWQTLYLNMISTGKHRKNTSDHPYIGHTLMSAPTLLTEVGGIRDRGRALG